MFEMLIAMNLPILSQVMDLQLFADAGSNVNATGNLTNAYTGVETPRTANNTEPGNDMSAEMKTYYNTEMLENTRDKLIFYQLGRKQSLPANHGRTIEWRKWNKLPDIHELKEAVIPAGLSLGATMVTADIAQYGDYVAVSDLLDLHAIDDVILGAQEELSASASLTMDKLARAQLAAQTNIMYADKVTLATGAKTAVSRESELVDNATAACRFTADTVNKAATHLRKLNAPFYSGNKYMAIIHPSCTYDLRKDPDWIEAHKYAKPEEIFNGEIGELHGVRFVESNLAPVVKVSEGLVKYKVFMFGKDAFYVIDPAGAGMRTIVKAASEVGGPLEQFSTVGVKFETGAKVLYPDRLVCIECTSSYSGEDEDNFTVA